MFLVWLLVQVGRAGSSGSLPRPAVWVGGRGWGLGLQGAPTRLPVHISWARTGQWIGPSGLALPGGRGWGGRGPGCPGSMGFGGVGPSRGSPLGSVPLGLQQHRRLWPQPLGAGWHFQTPACWASGGPASPACAGPSSPPAPRRALGGAGRVSFAQRQRSWDPNRPAGVRAMRPLSAPDTAPTLPLGPAPALGLLALWQTFPCFILLICEVRVGFCFRDRKLSWSSVQARKGVMVRRVVARGQGWGLRLDVGRGSVLPAQPWPPAQETPGSCGLGGAGREGVCASRWPVWQRRGWG